MRRRSVFPFPSDEDEEEMMDMEVSRQHRNPRKKRRSIRAWFRPSHWRWLACVLLLLCSSCWVLDRVLHVVNTLRRKSLRAVHERLKFGNATAVAELYDQHMTIDDCRTTTNAIFYNIYIPFDDDIATDRAFAIVAEQLQDIANANARYLSNHSILPTVYYNTIGFSNATTRIQSLCESFRLSCSHLAHFPSAEEGVTLQALYEHCQGGRSSQSYVTYLHSKGTFHDSPTNDRWRRALTPAALAPCCCDVCGLQFYTQFVPLFPGNMWTADCAYIRQLLPPHVAVVRNTSGPSPNDDYTSRSEAVIRQLLVLRAQGYLQSSLLPHDRIDAWGLDRYRYEHWIAGHPRLRTPCERVRANVSLQDIIHGTFVAFDDFENSAPNNSNILFRAPQRPGSCIGHDWPAHASLRQNTAARRREMVLLPGRLVQYQLLYGLPPNNRDAWQWQWFPDGAYWWEQLQSYHSNAQAAVTQRLAAPAVVEPTEANVTTLSVFLAQHASPPSHALQESLSQHIDIPVSVVVVPRGHTTTITTPLGVLDQYCQSKKANNTFVAFWNSSSAIALGDCLDRVMLSNGSSCCIWEDTASFFSSCPESMHVLGTLLLQRLRGRPVGDHLPFCDSMPSSRGES